MKHYTNGSFLYTRNWQLAQKSCKPRDKENTKYKINVTLSKKNAATTINGKPKEKREKEREDNMNNNKFRNEKENQRST